jgi:hypothetical protein
VLPSLLAFSAARYGLPPFSDVVEGVIPLDAPFRIRGAVVKGFGRGSKARGGLAARSGGGWARWRQAGAAPHAEAARSSKPAVG